jgi:hypothetical protein
MADVGIFPVDNNLSSSGNLQPAEMANIRRCPRRRAGIAFSGRQNFGHITPPVDPASDFTGGD